MNAPPSSGCGRPIRVLVVEDSPSARDLLVHIVNTDPAFQVVGTARDGEAAVRAVSCRKPDVVTMDVHMPKMDGLTATRKIMETNPLPIVIVSASFDPSETETCFVALAAGALAVAGKPQGIGHPEHEATARKLLRTLKLMAEVKVVRRRPAPERAPASMVAPPRARPGIRTVAIGASTGGPPVIQAILSRLPRDFPAAVLIVQHITDGFREGFVRWLADASRFPVHLAAHGSEALPGNAYVAPEGFLLGVEAGNRLSLSRDEGDNGNSTSVSHLFRSVAAACGPQAVGVLLTGMGKDGAEELGTMRARGAVTIAQDRESSVIYGMPGEAAKRNAAKYILPPEGIVEVLVRLVQPDDKRVDSNLVVPI